MDNHVSFIPTAHQNFEESKALIELIQLIAESYINLKQTLWLTLAVLTEVF